MRSVNSQTEELETRKNFSRNAGEMIGASMRASREGTEPPLLATQANALMLDRYDNEQKIREIENDLAATGPRLSAFDHSHKAKNSQVIIAG